MAADYYMPELPEVETVRRGLALHWVGRRILRVDLHRADLRLPFAPSFRQRLVGRTVLEVGRRAKYLLFRLDNDDVLIAHLGMSGSFRFQAKDGEKAKSLEEAENGLYRKIVRLSAHDHVIFHLSDDTLLIYNDPRRFGFMVFAPPGGVNEAPWLKNLGIEPLNPAIEGKILARCLGSTRRNLKTSLLDQKLIAGLGNIYVCEALHQAKLSPWSSSAKLSLAQAERLADAIVATLSRAIEAGGSTLRDFSSTDGERGYFQHKFRVYDREGESCPHNHCNARIQRRLQNGRSTFFCPSCQPSPSEVD